MDIKNNKLAEKMLLFLYAFSESSTKVNYNTYKRYIYLYYLVSSFLPVFSDDREDETIDIIIEKGDIKIFNFDDVLRYFETCEYISISESTIEITPELGIFVSPLVNNEAGITASRYREIRPFVNLLQSYSDQFIFTIFFSEPTFQSASLRGVKEIQSSNSELSKLLTAFKEKLNNSKVDEYDILTYWMDYILKNYYRETGEDGAI